MVETKEKASISSILVTNSPKNSHNNTNPNNNAFDLYSHLKCNIKCISSVCEIHDSNFTTYCLNCKRSICEVCKESFHSNHPTIEKEEVGMNKINVDKIFKDFENFIKNSEIFSNPQKIAQNLIDTTTNEIKTLQDKLEKIKEMRIEEIKSYFPITSKSHCDVLMSNLKKNQTDLMSFFKKVKDFFYETGINDDDCFIFLLNYELLIEGETTINHYRSLVDQIISIQETSEIMDKTLLKDIENEVNKTLNRFKVKNIIINTSNTNNNLNVNTSSKKRVNSRKSSNKTNNSIKKKNSNNKCLYGNNSNKYINGNSNGNGSDSYSNNNYFSTNNTNNKGANGSIDNRNSNVISPPKSPTKESNILIKFENNNAITSTNNNIINTDVSDLPALYQQLEDDKFIEMNNKIKLLDEHITYFREKVYSSFQKQGSLVEIERLVKQMEETATKRMIHMQRSSLRFSNSKANTKSQAGLSRSKAVLGVKQSLADSINTESKNTSNNNSLNTSPIKPKANKLKNSELNNNNNSNLDEKNKLKLKTKKLELFSLSEEDDEDEEQHTNRHNKNPRTTKNQTKTKRMLNHNSSSSISEGNSSISSNSLKKEDSSDVDDFFNNSSERNVIQVEFEQNKIRSQKKNLKLEKMFLPRKREFKVRKVFDAIKKTETSVDSGFMVNNNLLELIKENKRLINLIKTEADITLKITTIRRYFSFETLEFLRKALEHKDNHNVNQILLDDNKIKDKSKDISVKVFEGKGDMHILNKQDNKFSKYIVPFDKNRHKISYFPYGCRTIYHQDKLYITGGKIPNKGDINMFFVYTPSENKVLRLADMIKPRSYHTIIYHDNLKSLVVIGGENNYTCEMYDFYLNMWNPLPNMNISRANPLLYIDRIGAFAYAICGITGSITGNNFSDALECLDLIDMSQGWERVDYFNKANVDLKQNELKLYPLTEDKLLIYGAHVVRHERRCHVILDLKSFELQEVDERALDLLKVKLINPGSGGNIFSGSGHSSYNNNHNNE